MEDKFFWNLSKRSNSSTSRSRKEACGEVFIISGLYMGQGKGQWQQKLALSLPLLSQTA